MKRSFKIISAAFLLSFLTASHAAEQKTVSSTGLAVSFQTLSVPGLPDSLVRKKILLITDLHLVPESFKKPLIRELPWQVSALEPDWILLGGDTLNGLPPQDHSKIKPDFVKWASGMKAANGIYAVPGNHDEFLKDPDFFDGTGIRLLFNTAFPIEKGSRIYLGGLRDLPWRYRKMPKDVSELFAQFQQKNFLILLCHRPEILDVIPENTRTVILSGHTHGGIIQLPFFKGEQLLTKMQRDKKVMKYVSGWYKKGQCSMFVSSGVGGIGKSAIRIGFSPEIVLFTLEKSAVQ